MTFEIRIFILLVVPLTISFMSTFKKVFKKQSVYFIINLCYLFVENAVQENNSVRQKNS